jgi:Ca2+-transporting ATPase
MAEIFHSFNMRSQRKSLFSVKKQNKLLWLAGLGSLLLTTLVCEVPFLGNAFGFTHVGIVEYAIAAGLGFAVLPIVEIVKLFQRIFAKNK